MVGGGVEKGSRVKVAVVHWFPLEQFPPAQNLLHVLGRPSQVKEIMLRDGAGNLISKQVETFTWEKLDYVDKIKAAFGM